MGVDDNGDVGFQQSGSESMFKSSTGEEAFYGSGWDPLVPLNHGENFASSSVVPHNDFANSHYSGLLENKPVGSGSFSHLVNYPSDSALVNMVPKMPCFGSGSFSDIASSFGLQGCGVTEVGFHPNYSSMKAVGSQEDCLISDEGGFGSSSNGKKKRKASESHSPLNSKKNFEGEQQKDLSVNGSELSRERDQMKEKLEQPCKQAKDNSMSEEPSKETYVHVRAKRGQATNSHSLAERVRRERISERMRLLQELVPGCNKITGKAVMLDEIINYVQSLQQQVEFLSMKLATVNPEVNFDLDRMFSKDILHSSRGANAATLNIGPGLNSTHMFPRFPPGTFPGIPDASATFHHPVPQVWGNELQSILQMGFNSNTSINNPAQNGQSKLER